MSKKNFQKKAIHSGIGDGNHLLVKKPTLEESWEEFKVAARARGKKRNRAKVYPQVDFQYGIHYKGQTVETHHEEPYEFTVPAYPERVLEYDIEERRYLCYDRFWEIQADFEATVIHMNMQYAFEYEVRYDTEIPTEAKYRIGWIANGTEGVPMQYYIKWKGYYPYNKVSDVAKWLTSSNSKAQHLGPKSEGVWERGDSNGDTNSKGEYLVDNRNCPFFSGVAAKEYIDESYYEANFNFKPVYAQRAGQLYSGTHRAYGGKLISHSSSKADGGWDDDVIGIVFKYQGPKDYYIMMIEGEYRTYGGNSTRAAHKLDGFDTMKTGSKDWVIKASNENATDIWMGSVEATDKRDRTVGWGLKHRRVYRVKDGIMHRVDAGNGDHENTGSYKDADCKDKSLGKKGTYTHAQGWVMNKQHAVRMTSKGKRIKIEIKFPDTSDYDVIYDFDTAYTKGSFGLLNVSQSVSVGDFKVDFKKELSGRSPVDKYAVEEESEWQNKKILQNFMKESFRKELKDAKFPETDWKEVYVESEDFEKVIKSGTGTASNIKFASKNGSYLYGDLQTRCDVEDVNTGSYTYTEGWMSTKNTTGLTVKVNSIVKATEAYKKAVEDMNDVSLKIRISFKANYEGDVVTPYSKSTGTAVIKARLEDVESSKKGRYPETGWLQSDHFGPKQIAAKAGDYIKANGKLPNFDYAGASWDKVTITKITGIVKDDITAAYDVGWSPLEKNVTGWFNNPIDKKEPIVAYSNNPTDMDAVYKDTFWHCGYASICPDHRSLDTGNVVVPDTNVLFAPEIAKFFNRNTYINKKKVYKLLYPVWDKQVQQLLEAAVPADISLGGCIRSPGKDAVYSELIPCRPEKDDFWWGGTSLVMWTCDPPVEYKVLSYSYGVFGFEGEIKRLHNADFEIPNPWTTYKLVPIVETIENKYDYVKWSGTNELEWIAPYTPVALKTTRYFVPSWTGPYEGLNKGIITTDNDVMVEIPPIPEYYLDPETLVPMPYGYSNFKFLLESEKGFDLNTKLELWWLSNSKVTSLNVDRVPSNTNRMNGIYLLPALNMSDKIVVHCNEAPVYTDWTSGKYIGYGKLNGQEPLRCENSGKADMTNVSTDVIYFPDNFVEESKKGPFIDVYNVGEKYPDAKIDWSLSTDKSLVHFRTNYMDYNIWYTDWKSDWKPYDTLYKIKDSEILELRNLDELSIDLSKEDLSNLFIERIDVCTDNPFVISWSKDLTEEQLKEITGNIDAIDIMAIKDSWIQFDTDGSKGDWDFVVDQGIDKITNKVNQNGRSMWYNSEHKDLENYGFSVKVQVKDTSDDDMIGVIFRFDPETKSHYSLEWDCGGTDPNGLRLVRYDLKEDSTVFKEPIILASIPGYYWGRGQQKIYTIMVKVRYNSLKVYINGEVMFNVIEDPTTMLTKGAWGPVTLSQPDVFFWDLQMFEPQGSPEILAKVKDTKPKSWSPSVHNGYYYLEEKENYLYANKIVHTVTPNTQNEIIVSPRPEQAAPIIIQDKDGNNLRKVTFLDKSNYTPTLRNLERFRGNGNSAYYLGYNGIDRKTLIVTVNNKEEPYIFYDDISKIEFMRKLKEDDEIKVYYKVLYSYMIDMNYDVEGNRAKITLHNNYEASLMKNMTVTYEAASETPFYYADELKFNPLFNHNHSGFMYITDEAQNVKEVSMNISPRTLEISNSRKVLITAKVIDQLKNPVVDKEVLLYRNGKEVDISMYNNITNEAGEVYFYYTPINSSNDIPENYIEEYKVVCDDVYDIDTLNYYEKNILNRKYIDVELSKEAVVGGTSDTVEVKISLRDKDFRRLAGERIVIETINTNGTKNTITQTIPSNKFITFKVSGVGQKQGYVFVKITHNMGKEDAITMKAIKVLGG